MTTSFATSGQTADLVAAIFAVIAGATGLWLLYWAWTDRPHFDWRIRIVADSKDIDLSTVYIYSIGTGIAHQVEVHAAGLEDTGSPGHARSRMTADSEPIEMQIRPFNPGIQYPGLEAFIEIYWLRARPRREHGVRFRLKDMKQERWHRTRLRRKPGKWKLVDKSPKFRIPRTP